MIRFLVISSAQKGTLMNQKGIGRSFEPPISSCVKLYIYIKTKNKSILSVRHH
uniref:Uncharacterized protein n=1 Tax=Populus trichocarpa TaxID=3694 RepID=A0A2K1X5Q6_POPTR